MIADLIHDKVQTFPELMQREVLDFVEYLAQKRRQEDTGWTAFSLKAALRGLENETWPEYGPQDFKEQWS